jgi:UDP-N-acetylglucosamine:LPS N-acetylglucosamine transferase
MNNAKCEVIGPLAEIKHFTKKDPEKVLKSLAIPEGKDNVLIVSGSIGGKFLLQTVKNITADCSKPINLFVMCGRDKEIFKKIKAYKESNKNTIVNIMPYEYIDNFDEFLTITDCLIARPSAGIFIESLLNRTPMITFDVVTSNDKGTLTMIEKYNLGEICSNKSDLVEEMEKLLRDKETYKNNIDNLLSGYYTTYEEKGEALRHIVLNTPPISVHGEGNIDQDDYDGEVLYNN